jgi:hypothetical protein
VLFDLERKAGMFDFSLVTVHNTNLQRLLWDRSPSEFRTGHMRATFAGMRISPSASYLVQAGGRLMDASILMRLSWTIFSTSSAACSAIRAGQLITND